MRLVSFGRPTAEPRCRVQEASLSSSRASGQGGRPPKAWRTTEDQTPAHRRLSPAQGLREAGGHVAPRTRAGPGAGWRAASQRARKRYVAVEMTATVFVTGGSGLL